MKNKALLSCMATLMLIGCSNSPHIATNKSSPLKKGISHYYIKPPAVNLTLGHGAIPQDTTFANEEKLKKEFHDSLLESFKNKKILAESEAAADGTLEVKMDYTRKFNWGGKSLNKPEFSYSVTIKKSENELASYSVAGQTTFYGGLKESAVNFEIGAFKWDAEDEPKDIALIAETIAREVSSIGN